MDQAWQAWIYPGRLESLLPVSHVLFTHWHPDHFHPESLALLNRDAEVIVPTTAGSYLLNQARDAGFSGAREIHALEARRANELEVHSLRINDHWEFLDETAYLIVEDGVGILFLADLWYMPPALLARSLGGQRLAFASIPWGGSLESLCVLPEGYELGSLDEFYRYGMDENTIARRNAVMEHGGFSQIASVVDAHYMIPGSFGFGWIAPEDEFVKPMPVNQWLDQKAFIASTPDADLKSKLHPMYPGECYVTDSGEMRSLAAVRPNHKVTDDMRRRSKAPLDGSARLDPEYIRSRLLGKIADSLARLNGGSLFYRERLPHLLSAELAFEIQVVNQARQRFLFEQRGDRFDIRAIDQPIGLPDVVYMGPSVLTRLAQDWGPKWTDANFSGLVKVSATGWTPYKSLSTLFG